MRCHFDIQSNKVLQRNFFSGRVFWRFVAVRLRCCNVGADSWKYLLLPVSIISVLWGFNIYQLFHNHMVTWATHWTDWISVVLLNVGFYVDAEKCKVEKFIKSVSVSVFTSTLGAAAYIQPLNWVAAYTQPLNWVSQFTPIDTKSVPLSIMIRQQQNAHLIKCGEIQCKT